MNAMACGCTVLGSATPPVQEVIQHEQNGLLADFYDVDGFVELANKVLDDPEAFRPLGEAAVRMIEEKYSLDVCLPKMLDLYERTIAGYTKCGFPKAREAEPVVVGGDAESNGDGKPPWINFTFMQPSVDESKAYQKLTPESYGGAALRGQASAGYTRALAEPVAHAASSDKTRGRASRALRSQAEPGNESNAARRAAATWSAARHSAPTGESIRVLFAIPHAFGRDPSKSYHSFNGAASERLEALAACLKLLHQTFGGEQQEAALIRTALAPANMSLRHEIDVVICTSGQRHLLRELDVPSAYYRHEPRDCEPVMLGFECHALLRDNLGRYDFYCYLEDDLLIHDPWFFAKQRFFNLRAENECVLQPNRYEIEHNGEARKTYIDGDLDEQLVRKYQNVDDQPELALISMGVPIPCRRTLNPHCGGFFLNAQQMEHWSRQPHFLDKDCSFFSPIESANTFGIMRTFKIYKPAPSVANFLEIEHFGTSMLERLRERERKPRKALLV